jgi:transcription initiation factor TFIIH subunit 4
LEGLYTSAPACLAVYRELPPLAKNYIMRMLFTNPSSPFPLAMVKTWTVHEKVKDHEAAVNRLLNLRIWRQQALPGGLSGITVSADFQDNIKTVVLGGGRPWSVFGVVQDNDKHFKDVDYIVSYANERWETLLRFMVDIPGSHAGITKDVVEVMKFAGLMTSPSPDKLPTITHFGFQFLLLRQPAQVWYFMTQYLQSLQNRGLNALECLVFLLQISFATLGKDYSMEGMTDSQKSMIQNLREFGLVYQRKRSVPRYYPTQLAINLLSGSRGEDSSEKKAGYIILETNFHLLAYTNSPLQVAIIAIFCQLQYKFPNMVMGVITRDSIHEALKSGITAEQILTFLRTHAHPQMLAKLPIIPSTVVDQIKLWEMERDRLQFTDGVLYSQFMSLSDYELLKKYAEELGVLQWSSDRKRLMVVSNDGHDQVKRFWKRQKQSK